MCEHLLNISLCSGRIFGIWQKFGQVLIDISLKSISEKKMSQPYFYNSSRKSGMGTKKAEWEGE